MHSGQARTFQSCHAEGERATSVPVRSGHVQRSAVSPLSASSHSVRRPVSLASQRISENYVVVRENVAAVPQHQPPSAMTRTSPVSISRQIVLGSPPRSLGGSHTQPANSGIAAYGCYRLFGPAHISKRGDCLVARLLPGARLKFLAGGGLGGGAAAAATAVEAVANRAPGAPTRQRRAVTAAAAAAVLRAEADGWDGWDVECTCASGEEEDAGGVSNDGAVTECMLVAAYVELGGSASSADLVDAALQPAVHHHNGHTYLSVRNLPPSAVITLSADGDLSHPVNVTPTPPEAPAPAPRGPPRPTAAGGTCAAVECQSRRQ